MTYIERLQAELDNLNARRAPLTALIASEGFAALSDGARLSHHSNNNSAAARVAVLEAMIAAANP